MKCSICGRDIVAGVPCPYYQRQGLSTCGACCDICYRSEPFPCREYEERKAKEVKTMQTIKRGDVFYCEGSPEAIGSEEQKTRPVVIIQNDTGNQHSPTVIVANLTSVRYGRKLYPMQFDVKVPGLHLSRVLCEQIRTVDKARLREKVGELSPADLERLDQCLAVSFGMARQAAQEAPGSPPINDDDIFRALAQKGLSVAICPLPALGQINLSVVDGKTVTVTRNVADGILNEIADMARVAAEERGVTA